MKKKDYPCYYLAVDEASISAQRKHVRFVRIDLICISIAALLSIYNWNSINLKLTLYSISGTLLLGSIFVSYAIKAFGYGEIWYKGRAVAESCKTLTWRYITKSEDFDEKISDHAAKDLFRTRLNEISCNFISLNPHLSTKILSKDIFTAEMTRIRGLNLIERKKVYVNERILNQIRWYSSKAEANKRQHNCWFNGVIVCQILALFSIGYLIFYPTSSFVFTGFFTTLSATFLSWIQLKKFQENKEAYTTATIELQMIKQKAESILTEEDFSKFVLDSENAMSREHTLWLAQKRF